jgi:co-chaperonin GroES (HSP10)
MNIKPIRRNILIKLPNWYKNRERETPSGIIVPHLEGLHEHNATQGDVVACADDCTLIQPGDTVFFTNMAVTMGLQNIGRDKSRHDGFEEIGNTSPITYFIQGDAHYLLMPEHKIFTIFTDKFGGEYENISHTGAIAAIRDFELFAFNDYVLMQKDYFGGELVGIPGVGGKVNVVKSSGGIILGVQHQVKESEKRYKVFCAPADSEVQKGDVIYTMSNCDILLEGEFNNPLLPRGIYYVEAQNVLAVVEAMA